MRNGGHPVLVGEGLRSFVKDMNFFKRFWMFYLKKLLSFSFCAMYLLVSTPVDD